MNAKRWLVVIVVALASLSVLGSQQGPADGARANLKLVFEVRDRIHCDYVEEVDSLRVIDGAVDGLAAALPEGENLYISPREMAEVGSPAPAERLDDRGQVALLAEAFGRISKEYVRSVGADTLARGMVEGMLSSLDPHSSYLDPAEREEMVERFRGDFEGIGIYFEIRQGRLMVISPIVGSPSEGKLRAGDEIIEIEGVPTDGITNEQVMKKLRGPKGSSVRVTVARQGRDEPLAVTIRRDRIEVRSVPYAFMLAPEVGYVRIARFAETTAQELGEDLARLRSEGARRLLLDLRDNGGGLLDQAVEVADFFLDADELIVYTQGRAARSRQEYRDTTPLENPPLSVIVVIDHGSASASEIVAGAIQDQDRGLVVGQTSFGKGLVQEQYPLTSNGGLLLLTVARYYTPVGRLIQRPFTGDLQAYVHQGVDSLDPNAVDSLRAAGAVFHTTLGRPVYGAGGITPDVSLPDPEFSEFEQRVFAEGALADFCSQAVGKGQVPAMPFAAYAATWQVPDSLLAAFGRALAARGVAAGPDAMAAHRAFLQTQLKAGFARVLWSDQAAYQISLQADTQIQAAARLFDRADQLQAARAQATSKR